MNKLLKVLEDRCVFLESAYYSSSDNSIPAHIHEMFQKGLPADFRLVGATTRMPEELPAALRSRCVEIFFKPLTNSEIGKIAKNAALKGGVTLTIGANELIERYAQNGRDAVNIVQIASNVAVFENRKTIDKGDIEWVVEFSRYNPKPEKKVQKGSAVGFVNGLAVYGGSYGTLMDIEVNAVPGNGELCITGIIENEEITPSGVQKLSRKSSAKASVENMLTVLKRFYNINFSKYDIHINFPGCATVDGPSAGIAVVCAVYSAINNLPIDIELAMTGEISIQGLVRQVGGVVEKVEAAQNANIKKVIIPRENYREAFADMPIKVVCADTIEDVFKETFGMEFISRHHGSAHPGNIGAITAASVLKTTDTTI